MLDRRQLSQAMRDPHHKGFAGETLGRYEILGTIGRGGAGQVFRAKHSELGALVALKVLLQQDPSEEAVNRFRREGRVLAQLKHKHVVGISDLGEENGIPYLVMELIEGQNLFSVVRGPGGRLPEPEETVEIVLAIAQALDYCHQSGVFHRDVKPNNILIEHGTQRPVLTDFGLVKRDPNKKGAASGPAGISATITHAGRLVGTPSFMAPEQFDPGAEFGEPGPKSDVWGLGATLYFLLTGQPPFTSENVVDLFTSVTTEDVPPPRTVRPTIPAALDAVCLATLQRDPEKRISMHELATRLESLQGGLKQASTRRGMKQATFVVVALLALVILDLTVLNPQRGAALLRKVTGAPDPADAPLTAEQVKALVKDGKAKYEAEDYVGALERFEKAADHESPAALFWVAWLHDPTRPHAGIAPDGAKALAAYRQASTQAEDAETRARCEKQIQKLLEAHPELAQ
ncbi:MAG: serine/threonine-protein kinase [Planctomycetota bacterium]